MKTALDHDEVDAVLVAFACVGDCQPEKVTAAIGSAVHRVEVAGGVDKPVLLCIMGAHGTVAAVSGGGRRVFPAYRFPESAPRALAQGRALRRVPPAPPRPGGLVRGRRRGRGAARGAGGARGDRLTTTPSHCRPEAAGRVLAAFGIGAADGRDGPISAFAFVPTRCSGRSSRWPPLGGPAVVRITPLTINDVDAGPRAVGAPHDDAVAETIGRLSQLVEELPWVWSLEGRVTATAAPALMSSTTLTIRRVASGETSRP